MQSVGSDGRRNSYRQATGSTHRLRRSRCALIVAVSWGVLACGGEAWSPDAEAAPPDPAERSSAQDSVGPSSTPDMPASEPSPGWGIEAPIDTPAGPGLPAPERSSRLPREPLSLGAGASIYTWGGTGVMYRDHPGNLRLLGNVLTSLGASAIPGDMRILYTAHCDPREHANLCRVAGDAGILAGFFDMVAEHGSITFEPLSVPTAQEYDVVIYDACDAGEGSPAELRQFLAEGGRVLILADNFCNSSARHMNAALPNIGLSFSTEDPGEPELFTVPPEARTGVLEGVETLNIFRVVPQIITHSFTPVVESPNGILMARREGPTARLR